MRAPSSYSYAGIEYANPDAVTQIASGLRFAYDADGNLTQKTRRLQRYRLYFFTAGFRAVANVK